MTIGNKKTAYEVIFRQLATGKTRMMLVFASDATAASERAIIRARRAFAASRSFVEMQYVSTGSGELGQFEVTGCTLATAPYRISRKPRRWPRRRKIARRITP